MTFIKSRILLADAVFLLSLSACNSAGPMKTAAPAKDAVATPAKDGVAATVNGMPISESHVKLLAQMRGDLDTPESRKNIAGFKLLFGDVMNYGKLNNHVVNVKLKPGLSGRALSGVDILRNW